MVVIFAILNFDIELWKIKHPHCYQCGGHQEKLMFSEHYHVFTWHKDTFYDNIRQYY